MGNPAERYEYYSLPFCAPSDVHNKKENFGEVLAGDRRTTSLYDLRFRADNALVRICKFSLNQNETKWFRDAIKQHYVFEFFVGKFVLCVILFDDRLRAGWMED